MVELFDDVAPMAVSLFRSRCGESASDTFQGTAVHRVVPELGIFGGRSTKCVR